jgi:hypothetical protein
MDSKVFIAQRARDFFGDRLDDVCHMIRQDREDMRGWQEPAHLRAVVRKAIREEQGSVSEAATLATTELELTRPAAEPDRGQQREAIGQLLERALSALERMAHSANPDLSNAELVGLETALLLYARPALLMDANTLASVPPFWNILEDQREAIEQAQLGVGRIDLLGHPEYDWAGTGFLVADNLLLTTRRAVEMFAEERDGRWQFRPGITAWMDYRSQTRGAASAGYRVTNIRGTHATYDLAILEVEPPQRNGVNPLPLPLAAFAPERLEGRPVYMVSFPVRDSRRGEPEMIARIFRDAYSVKRIQPGQLRQLIRFGDVELLRHDAAPLGVTAGAPILDLETQQVVGMQLTGRYLDGNTAVPLFALRHDPLFVSNGISFIEATSREQEEAQAQLQRLARTRFWREARTMLADLYRRAFGDGTMI